MKKKWRNCSVNVLNRCKRIVKIINLTFIMTICLVSGLSANGFSQQKVTMNLDNATLKEVLSEFQKITGTIVIYSSDKLETSKKVKAVFKNIEQDDFLKTVLADSDMSYKIMDDYILIVPKENKNVPQVSERTITGKVTDPKGELLPGVTVVIKDTKIGTATNVSGEYKLNVPDLQNIVLIFSFVGMESKEVNVQNRTTLDVVLEYEITEVDEVVVTGMFTRKKESFTGSATTFTQDDLKRMGTQNIIASLKNMDPSFIVSDNLEFGSDPNTLPDMKIRGTSTLGDLKGEYQGNPNEPLFILDGFETSSTTIYDLDINRISTVTILKDAAAKAIYGSKAANGVIVIETIIPEAGKLRLTYNGTLDIQAPDLSYYDLTNAREKLEVEVNAGRYASKIPLIQQLLNEQYNEILKSVTEGIDTYWLSKPLRTGVGQKHAIYMEGGDENMRYGVDVSYNKISGVMKDSDRETVSGTINLSYRYKNLIFRNVLTVTFNRADDSPYGSFSEYTNLNPYWTAYDENGNLKKVLGTFQSTTSDETTIYYNPLYNSKVGTKNFSKYTSITENFYTEYQVLNNLKLIGRFGFTYTTDTREDFYPGDHTRFAHMTGDDFYKRGTYYISNGEAKNLSTDVTVNYSKQFGDHLIFANALWNITTANDDSHGMTAQGFLNNRVDHITFAKQYLENGTPSGSESRSREVGVVGSINYSYDNRYLADFSIRSNASSKFGKNSRWGTFWSVGIGWNMHYEKFLSNQNVIDQLKLRSSIGYTGSQNFDTYQAMRTYKFYQDRTYDNISGAYLIALANNDLKWQQKQDLNFGFDGQFFKRLTLRFDYFISNTDNLLVDFTLPTSTGFSTFKQNIGSIQNKGFEATLNLQVYRNPSEQSFVSIYGSTIKSTSKIKKISDALKNFNEEQDSQTDNLTVPLTRYEEGQSLTAIWVVKSLGIDPITGKEIFVTKEGEQTYSWNSQDQIIGGDSNPKYQGNIGINSEYKGFGLNLSFRYQLGGDYYNQTLVSKVENVDIANNVDRRVFTGTWQNPGDVTFFKKITSSPTTTRPSSRFVEKENTLSLASLNISYDFKNFNLAKYKLERLKLSFYMNDVFRVSTVKTERGTSYPFARSFNFALQATF